MIFHRTLIWVIDISRRNSKKDLKRVTTKRKPRSLHLQMMNKLNRERCVHSENGIPQNSINLTCMGTDRCQIVKYSSLSDTSYTDIASYRYIFLLLLCLAFTKIRGVFRFGCLHLLLVLGQWDPLLFALESLYLKKVME
jgi:hypothetical protein